MDNLGLLTSDQFNEIAAWLDSPLSNQEIKQMPEPLWTALSHAATLLAFNPKALGLFAN